MPGRGRDERRERLRVLRSTEAPAPARLFIATLRVQIPRSIWTGPFSTENPTVRLEALNRTEVGAHLSVSDYWISGAPPGGWARKIEGYPDVQGVESLAEVGDGCLYRITYRNPPILNLYRRLHLPVQFPLRIQGGYLNWEVVARRAEFDEVLRYTRKVNVGMTIVSIRRRPLRSHLPILTETQQELLTNAMAAGYFAVPRGITLTDLAQRLGRSKSSISEAIAIIEKKLLETAMRSPSGSG
ncbi:MAG: helix-turn-helix domain-containing protein [Thermoplasmata archaeon]